MTREEVAALIDQIPQGIHVDEFIVMLATKAAEYEREQCAKAIDAAAAICVPGLTRDVLHEQARCIRSRP
jgi:hypothetical protein